MAKIDLDLHQMDILMKMNEDNFWYMARHIYLYGKNSLKVDDINDDFDDDYYGLAHRERMSIHSIAVSNERTGQFYDAFLDYHNDKSFSDKIIQNTFDDVGKWRGRPNDVRARVIIEIIQVQVIYMFVLSKLDMAVSQCSGLLWDEAAALIIGTLEGDEKGGAKDFRDGKLLWGLANKRGLDFRRLNDEVYSFVNASLENLLFSGKGKILAGSCTNLGHTSKRISHLLLIPVIQNVIKYAISNEFLPPTSLEPGVALGEVNANVVIPIFGMYDADSAELINRNMIVTTFGILVESGPQAVADAYLKISESFGIECDYIGVRYEVDGCANYKDIMKDPDNEDISSVAVRNLSFVPCCTIIVGALLLLI